MSTEELSLMSVNFAQLDFQINATCMPILESTIRESRELKKYLKYRICTKPWSNVENMIGALCNDL